MYKNKKRLAKRLKKQYKNISKKMILIGITGTNGKTTSSFLLYKYFIFNKIPVTLIGSNGIFINDNYEENINTTPGIDIIYDVLKRSYEKNIKYIIMEVSSHAIKQYRIFGLSFQIKAITNITLDHMDFHKCFKDYEKTKLIFLKKGNVIINSDIIQAKKIKNNLLRKVFLYGSNNNEFFFNNIKISENTIFTLNYKNKKYLIQTNLKGIFNVYNISLFIRILTILNIFEYDKVRLFLTKNIVIPGRMNEFHYNSKLIVVDYAHTPDGIEKVLSYYQSINKKIITILGCGGNRDKTKRPIMGNISSELSDFVIYTTDNPRNENPLLIIKDITSGINKNNYLIEEDRKKAIDIGFNLLKNYDCLLILGRGNDNYYFLSDKKIYFNDIKYIKGKINNE